MAPGTPAAALHGLNVLFGPIFEDSGLIALAALVNEDQQQRKRKRPAPKIQFDHDANVEFLYRSYFRPRRRARFKKHSRVELKDFAELLKLLEENVVA